MNRFEKIINSYSYHEVVSPEVFILCKKNMAREETVDCNFLINSLIYLNKLAYLPLITISVYVNSPPESHEKDYSNETFSENIEKYV